MSYDYISVVSENRVTRITFGRPEVMNAINKPMHEELQSAIDTFAADSDQYICVLTGAGSRAFCAGSDLKAIAASDGEKRHQYPKNGYAGLIERYDLDKPVIAAVNGVALGGGFEIALACDIIVASDKATFALPEPKVGLAAGSGGMQRLSRMIPLKKAMGMLLTGRHVSAQESFELGFVTEVVPNHELMNAARRWARDILACSPMSVRATKQVVMRSLDAPALETVMHNLDYPAFVAMTRSEETVEGPRAFAEERKPDWKGR